MDIIKYFTFLTGFTPTKDQESLLLDLINMDINKIIISAGRQSGKTLTTAVAILWLIFESGLKVKILLVSAQDNILYYHLREIFKNHPEFAPEIVAQGTYSLVPLHGFEVKNGNQVFVRGATEKQIRGLPADLVICDEACEIKSDTILTALGNLSGPISKFILLSTPHVDLSLFVKWATDKKAGFKVHQWSAEGLSWHNPVIMETKKKEMTAAKYAVEVLGRPPSKAERAFFPFKQVEACRIDTEPIREGGEKSTVEAGIDWGEMICPTCVVITEKLSPTKRKVLACKTWKGMIETNLKEIADLIILHNVLVVKVDSRPAGFREKLEPYLGRIEIKDINMAQHKQPMLGQLQKRIRHKQLIIPTKFVDLIKELESYRFNSGEELKYSSYKGNKRTNDDRVDGLALSCYEPIVPIKVMGHSGFILS